MTSLVPVRSFGGTILEHSFQWMYTKADGTAAGHGQSTSKYSNMRAPVGACRVRL